MLKVAGYVVFALILAFFAWHDFFRHAEVGGTLLLLFIGAFIVMMLNLRFGS